MYDELLIILISSSTLSAFRPSTLLTCGWGFSISLVPCGTGAGCGETLFLAPFSGSRGCDSVLVAASSTSSILAVFDFNQFEFLVLDTSVFEFCEKNSELFDLLQRHLPLAVLCSAQKVGDTREKVVLSWSEGLQTSLWPCFTVSHLESSLPSLVCLLAWWLVWFPASSSHKLFKDNQGSTSIHFVHSRFSLDTCLACTLCECAAGARL
jgi:hypothetical protein